MILKLNILKRARDFVSWYKAPIFVVATAILLGGFFIAPGSALAADTGFLSPTANVNSGWASPENGYASDNARTVADSSSDVVVYYNFSSSIPAGSTINGIEVRIEGYTGGSRQADISLSWNGGTSFTTGTGLKTTNVPTDTSAPFNDGVSLLGGASDLWNRTWSLSDFTNFRVSLNATTGGGSNLNIDQVQIKIYYTADIIAPVIATHAMMIDLVANAFGGSTVAYTNPTVTDNVDTSISATCLPASGSLFPIGTTTVTCNAQDAAGNHATPTTFLVVVGVGPVSAAASTVVVSNDFVNTSGGVTTITITAKDQFGNPISGIIPANISVTASGINNTITPQTTPTNAAGIFTATLQSITPQSKTITVTINGVVLNQKPVVNFYATTPAKATITASPLTQEASLSGAVINLDVAVADGYDYLVPDGNAIWVVPATTALHGTPVSSCPFTSQVLTFGGHVNCSINFNYRGDVTLQVYSIASGKITSLGDTTIHFTDTTKPKITLNGDNTVFVEYRGIYTDLGATAFDNIDGNITADIVAINPVSTNVVMYNPAHTGQIVASYEVTYNVKDASGNSADEVTRLVNVEDTTNPEVTSLTSNATTPGWLKVGDSITFTVALSPAEPIATVAGSYNGKALTWSTSNGGATYAATYTVTEGESDHLTPLQISGVVVTDEAENSVSIGGSDVAKTIDANTPAAPIVDLLLYVNIANVASTPLVVTGEVGITVDYTVGTVSGSGTVGSDGTVTFLLDLTALPQGLVSAAVTLTDAAGNISLAGNDTATKDTIAPDAPVVALPTYINTLNQTAPTISGSGEAAATVAYTVTDTDDATVTGSGAVTPGTTISFAANDLYGLIDGSLALTASQTDLAGNTSAVSALSYTTKETIKPTLTALDSDGKRFKVGNYLITATFTEPVTSPKIAVAYSSINGTCADIAANAMTATAEANVYTYDLVVGDACDGALGTATISDATDVPGNIINADSTHIFVVDTLAPVFSATAPANDAYIKADFSVVYTLNEDLQSGNLEIFGSPVHAYTLTGLDLIAGTHTITGSSFTGTFIDGHVYSISFNGVDLAGNGATFTNTNITYDITAPTVINVTSPKTDGAYKAGEVIDVTVQFSEPVNATTHYVPAGCGYWSWSSCWDAIDERPYLILETGTTDRTINYSSGSGSDTLVFSYTVQPGDTSADLDYLSASALYLNGQAIRDLAGNDTNLALPLPGATNSLGYNKNIVIDTTAPSAVLSTSAPDPTNTSPIPATATFSEPVTGFELGDIVVGNGVASNFVAVSPTVYTFDITPTADGEVTINVPSASVIDIAANANTAADQLSLVYDATKPQVASVNFKEGAVASDSLVKAGDVLTIEVMFDEPMAATPLPTIAISGSNILAATNLTRVDATHYTYNYTVGAGDGFAYVAIIGGKDLAGNIQVDSNSSKFTVDNTKPVITQHAPVVEAANSFGGKVVTYEVIATDTQDGPVTAICTPASGTKFAVSLTTAVTCNVTDQAGNAADPMTFDITVNPDNIAQLIVTGVTPVTTDQSSVISVTGKDQYGNITTNQSGTIVAITADNGGALAETLVTLVSGLAGTTLTKSVAGDVHVTVTSGTLIPGNTTVHFNPADTTGPNITAFSPAVGATDVSVSAPLFFIFNETLKLATVNSTNVQLWKAGIDGAPAEQVSAIVSLVEGGKRVDLTPAAPLAYSTSYYFVVTAGITDEANNAQTTPKNSVNTGFTTALNTADIIAPTVIAQSPLAETSGVLVTVNPYVDFSEPMKLATLLSTNVQLRKSTDNSVVPASIAVENGGTRAVIKPTASLDLNTSYYVHVGTGVTDEAGNALAAAYTGGAFTTERDSTVLAVTGISALSTYATADDTFEHGWKWAINVTAPTAETELRVKFSDFVSGTNVIPAAVNIRYSSVQASGGPVVISAADIYGSAISLTGDLDPSTLGRQFQIIVEVKVPVGSAGGSYSTSYGIDTSAPAL